MILQNNRQMLNTQQKLAEIEARYQRLQNEPFVDENTQRVNQSTLRSMSTVIKQLREEIAYFETRVLTTR